MPHILAPLGTADKTALVDQGDATSYQQLEDLIERCASGLLGEKADLAEERVAFFLPAGLAYVTTLFAVWRTGGLAVPLNTGSALPELEHYLSVAGCQRLIALPEQQDFLAPLCAELGISLHAPADFDAQAKSVLPALEAERRALMIFTSGTTSKPKGVVSTHRNLRAQVDTLLKAWGWSSEDRIPLFLPLHHVHGLINVLCCALCAGASLEAFRGFQAEQVLERVAAGAYTLFMAVPTVYARILEQLKPMELEKQQRIIDGFSAMRLNVSGSAACPAPLFMHWRETTGQVLLERYGMTEIGMALSNPYEGERRAGMVGLPLPGVDIRLVAADGTVIQEEQSPGEIQVQSANVFLEYWNKPEATAESFDGPWFKTGDVAQREQGYYRILGRSSIDIIKSGGFKLSALEIESKLLEHPAIAECAVLGVVDDTWGEIVKAFVVLAPAAQLDYPSLKDWCEGRMSSYKIPRELELLKALPRNAMGKVTKPALRGKDSA